MEVHNAFRHPKACGPVAFRRAPAVAARAILRSPACPVEVAARAMCAEPVVRCAMDCHARQRVGLCGTCRRCWVAGGRLCSTSSSPHGGKASREASAQLAGLISARWQAYADAGGRGRNSCALCMFAWRARDALPSCRLLRMAQQHGRRQLLSHCEAASYGTGPAARPRAFPLGTTDLRPWRIARWPPASSGRLRRPPPTASGSKASSRRRRRGRTPAAALRVASRRPLGVGGRPPNSNDDPAIPHGPRHPAR